MFNVYLIDYYNKNNSGLSTYLSELKQYIDKDNNIILHLILVKADFCQTIQHVAHPRGNIYYIPFDIGLSTSEDNARQIADALHQSIVLNKQVIFHFNWINHAPFARYLKKRFDCHTILTKHCIPWRDFITTDYQIFKYLNDNLTSGENYKYLDKALQREESAYNSVDHIICVTEFAKKSLKHFFKIPQNKLSVIYNGLDYNPKKTKDTNPIRKHYGFQKDEIIILYAGSIVHRKGIYDLISAFEQSLDNIENIRLVIAGAGDFNQAFASIKNNGSKITFTGSIDKKRLYDLYRIADIGVVPSYVEQCSYTAIEMMHNEVSLIVANVDGLGEIVPDDCALKVPLVLEKNNARIDGSKLSSSIQELVRSPKKRRELAKRAKQHASKTFTTKNMYSLTVKQYNNLLNGANNGSQDYISYPGNELISIILPCFNGKKYLNSCIKSILTQTYPHFELIIINDASTDSTQDIVEQFNDPRIFLINNHNNLGLVASLNIGVEQAKGKYIARIDADDLMHKDRMLKQIEFLENKENENIGILGSYHYIIDATGRIIGSKQYPNSPEDVDTISFFQNPFSHPSVMIRAHILKEFKYNDEFIYAEDYDLWFKILKHHKGTNIPEYLTSYRIHDKNTSLQNIQFQKESVANLLSGELEQRGIEHSVSELSIHLAIYFGYNTKFFNDLTKVKALEIWIMKVLYALQQFNNYTDKYILEISDHIKRLYCGIYKTN